MPGGQPCANASADGRSITAALISDPPPRPLPSSALTLSPMRRSNRPVALPRAGCPSSQLKRTMPWHLGEGRGELAGQIFLAALEQIDAQRRAIARRGRAPAKPRRRHRAAIAAADDQHVAVRGHASGVARISLHQHLGGLGQPAFVLGVRASLQSSLFERDAASRRSMAAASAWPSVCSSVGLRSSGTPAACAACCSAAPVSAVTMTAGKAGRSTRRRSMASKPFAWPSSRQSTTAASGALAPRQLQGLVEAGRRPAPGSRARRAHSGRRRAPSRRRRAPARARPCRLQRGAGLRGVGLGRGRRRAVAG